MKFHNIDRSKIPEGASFVVKAIHRMGSLLAKRTNEELAHGKDFNLAEWRIASGLYAFGKSSQKTLVEYTGSEQAHTSRVLAGLEHRGLARSEQSREDKRAREFEMTDAGKAAFEGALPNMSKFFGGIDQSLSNDELTMFIDILERLLVAADGDTVRVEAQIRKASD